MDIEDIQARLAAIAVQEAELRDVRKGLEHELAALKVGREFDGPVIDADGAIISTEIEGVTGTASGVGEVPW